jgi:hypothetical protein
LFCRVGGSDLGVIEALPALLVLSDAALDEIFDQIFIVCRERHTEGFFDGLALTDGEIDADPASEGDQVASGVTVASGVLGEQLFDACGRHRHPLFLVTAPDRDLLAEPLLE